uniref:Zona pellucida glycoprotein 3f, tandem duplicate 1 n=1 Tax=Hucho hucho TaxID=62062 RepID=A0A4W5KDA2_9TELE
MFNLFTLYCSPVDWAPPILDLVLFHTYGEGDLVYHMGLMKDDFSGPHLSREYPLGSFIHILATLEQKAHQPLLLLIEECGDRNTRAAAGGLRVPYHQGVCTIGCLVDSMTSNSKFEPRQETSDIHLSLQAFKFTVGEEVYIHCKILAWDPSGLDTSRKACHYVQGWELLDDPSHSNLCSCCDSSCKSQRRRGIPSGITSFCTPLKFNLLIVPGH